MQGQRVNQYQLTLIKVKISTRKDLLTDDQEVCNIPAGSGIEPYFPVDAQLLQEHPIVSYYQ